MRVVFYLFLAILILTLLRSVIGLIAKGASGLFQPSQPESARRRSRDVPLQGELKKDPVCGTYVSTASSVKKTLNGEVVHFCSEACRDKYAAEPRPNRR